MRVYSLESLVWIIVVNKLNDLSGGILQGVLRCDRRKQAAMTRKADSRQTMDDGQWATPYNLNPGETHYHELSHTQVWVSCLDQEWQVRFQRMPEDENQDRWLQTVSDAAPNPDLAVQ